VWHILHINCTILLYCNLIMSFRINDLKRLRKDELLELARDSFNNCDDVKRMKKSEIIDLLCSSKQSPPTTEHAETEIEQSIMILELINPSAGYRRLADTDTLQLPNITSQSIYCYITNSSADGIQSCKSLDRAVKHTSAGDVKDVKFSKVY